MGIGIQQIERGISYARTYLAGTNGLRIAKRAEEIASCKKLMSESIKEGRKTWANQGLDFMQDFTKVRIDVAKEIESLERRHNAGEVLSLKEYKKLFEAKEDMLELKNFGKEVTGLDMIG